MTAPLLALLLAASSASGARAHVDTEAMREAIVASQSDEGFASSAAYAHFLASRIAHQRGDHPEAIAQLRLALASDDGEPYLVTALAEELARTLDLGRSKRLLSDLLRRHPRYVPAQLLLGRVLYELHQPRRAAPHLKKAIALAPTRSEAYLLLAEIALEADHPDRAIAIVGKLWERARDPLGLRKLGGALAERGDLTRARAVLRRAAEAQPDDPDAWAALAQVDEALGDDAQAERDFAQALERDPDDKDALLNAGRAALRLRKGDHARAYFDRLLSLGGDPEAELQIAFSYLTAHRPEDAARVLDASLKEPDASPKLAFWAGLVHEHEGELEAAARAFARVLPEGELGKDALLHRARCLTRLGQGDRARALLQAASADHPEDPALTSAWASALERAGQTLQAEKVLRDAMAAHPSPVLVQSLAELLQRNGGQAAAVELLTHARSESPKDASLAYALGVAYERGGDHARALGQMREVLKLQPDNAAAMNFIGYELASLGQDLDEAQRLLERALELQPDSGAFLDSLGWVYFQKGDFQKAAGTLERAVALEPGEPVILEHLGDAYRKLDRRERASLAYKRALEVLRARAEDADTRGLAGELARKLKMLSTEASGR